MTCARSALRLPRALRPVLVRLGRRRVQDVTPEQVSALVAWMRESGSAEGKPLSHRSVVYALGSLRQVMRYGVRLGLIRTNPAAEVSPPRKRKVDTRETVTWTPAQLRAFLAAGDTDAEWAHVWRMVGCGMRRSEVLGLDWTNVDREAGTVRVVQSRVRVGGRTVTDDPKSTASWRTVYVEDTHPGSKAMLRAAYLAAEDKGGLIVRDSFGREASPATFVARFRAVCAAAGVPVIRPHAIRHTLAMILHRAGMPPRDAAKMLGHSVQTHLAFYLPGDEEGARSAGVALRGVLDAAAEG